MPEMAAMTPPVPLVLRSDEVIEEMARLVVVAFVAVALVNTPVDGVSVPIGVLLMVPPLMVSASGICASVARPWRLEK